MARIHVVGSLNGNTRNNCLCHLHVTGPGPGTCISMAGGLTMNGD